MLKDLLDKKQCFKLVCGAGNEDTKEVEKLVAIYSLAGCNFFDVCANKDVVDAAKRGLLKAGIEDNRYLCVSVGIKGDPHVSKAEINQDVCIKCGNCKEICIHNAIEEHDNIFEVNKKRCLGCHACANDCPSNAIQIVDTLVDYDKILPELIEKNIDCIEFHAISNNEEDVLDKWNRLNKVFDKMLCISVDRSFSGDKKLLELIKNMVSKRKPYTTIIQADGVAMSGSNDEYGTTLQAVATAQMFQNANLKAYIMMSGGTNTKSTQLAKLCGVQPNCLAMGSYARKAIKEYLDKDNLLEDKNSLQRAVEIAKNIIKTSLENMKND